jgi:gluconolactonase
VADDDNHPNGLAFSPDEKILTIESRADPRNILAFDVGANGKRLRKRRVFVACEPGETPDGFRVDARNGTRWAVRLGHDRRVPWRARL